MNKLVEVETKTLKMIDEQTRQEAQNIYEAAQEDAGFDAMMKFKKGHYYVDGEEIKIGTEYTAMCMLWTKSWVKFKGGGVQDRKVYPQIRRERAPERVDLDELDKTHWEMGLDGRPKDPWVFQYLLPLENKNGDRVIFVTSSFGGRRAVSDVCAAWGRKAAKDASAGLPIVQLTEAMMPTKKFGDVPRPHFQIIRWENSSRLEPVREIDPNALSGGEMEMNDEIPF